MKVPQLTSLSTSTQVNSLESPLLRLPAEIRTKIFEYVLVGDKPFHIDKVLPRNMRTTLSNCPRQCPCRKAKTGCPFQPDSHISFLRVCRQIYDESSLMFYALNTFHLPLATHIVNAFATTLCEGQRHALRYIELPSSQFVNEILLRHDIPHVWSERFIKEKPLTELFPSLQSVKVREDRYCTAQIANCLRVFPLSLTLSALADIREMLLGESNDVKLVLPKIMADAMRSG
jgi:hypothetical protein